MQTGALLFGVLIMWADQGSDIWLGVDYYNNCHPNWALISFMFTCLPTMTLIIFAFLACFVDVGIVCFLLAVIILQPFVVTYLAFASLIGNDFDLATWGVQRGVLMIKVFKALEVILEAIPQLLFNCLVRSVQSDNERFKCNTAGEHFYLLPCSATFLGRFLCVFPCQDWIARIGRCFKITGNTCW